MQTTDNGSHKNHENGQHFVEFSEPAFHKSLESKPRDSGGHHLSSSRLCCVHFPFCQPMLADCVCLHTTCILPMPVITDAVFKSGCSFYWRGTPPFAEIRLCVTPAGHTKPKTRCFITFVSEKMSNVLSTGRLSISFLVQVFVLHWCRVTYTYYICQWKQVKRNITHCGTPTGHTKPKNTVFVSHLWVKEAYRYIVGYTVLSLSLTGRSRRRS